MEKKLIIIGSGLAGLSAAITAAERGQKSILLSVQPPERAQSVLAEGGLSGELSEEAEALAEHYQDTMKAGGYLAGPESVKELVGAAPAVIRWLQRLGTPFQNDGTELARRQMGGHSRARTVFAGDRTGKAIMAALADEARRYEAAGMIERMSSHHFLQLILRDDQCRGCMVRNWRSGRVYQLTGPVILACGGLSGLFPGWSTGSGQNTGAAAAAVFRQGIVLGNLEFIQYHPTTFQISGKRCLVSEAARGEGGRLFAIRGGARWYFMEELYGPDGNLAPRDLVSRTMEQIRRRPDFRFGGFWLDLTGIRKDAWKNGLAGLHEECMSYLHLNPEHEPVPVEPGIHYFMGGILTDAAHRASKRFLYAAGECACQYHGANRLGGNSMLGAVWGGIRAAETAVMELPEFQQTPEEIEDSPAETAEWEELSIRVRKKIGEILAASLGVIRSEEGMEKGLRELEEWRSRTALSRLEQDEVLLGTAMLRSALARRESRGAHWREDCPEQLEKFQKTTAAFYDGHQIQIQFRPVPGTKEA